MVIYSLCNMDQYHYYLQYVEQSSYSTCCEFMSTIICYNIVDEKIENLLFCFYFLLYSLSGLTSHSPPPLAIECLRGSLHFIS